MTDLPRVCLLKNIFVEALNNPLPAPSQPMVPALDADIGARIKSAREERGFTQSVVAHRTKMADEAQRGISRTSIIGYEQGTSSPGLREIKLLCQVLLVTPNYLVYGTDVANAKATLPSMEFFSYGSQNAVQHVMQAALAMISLKGHERDALLSLVLSLAGRQLGDARLSGLLIAGNLMSDSFLKQLKEFVPNADANTSLEDIASAISTQMGTTWGTRLRMDDEDDPTIVSSGKWLYPEPEKAKKS